METGQGHDGLLSGLRAADLRRVRIKAVYTRRRRLESARQNRLHKVRLVQRFTSPPPEKFLAPSTVCKKVRRRQSGGTHPHVILRRMAASPPHTDLWEPAAQLVARLRRLLRGAAPEAFAAIAAESRALLAAAAALVRRYIHVLAATLCLGPPRPATGEPDRAQAARPASPAERYLFPLIEQPAPSRGRASPGGGADSPVLQWHLLWIAAARLAAVMADPLPHARRLARRQRSGPAPLRDLPVRWHVLRRLGPGVDVILMRLDQAARPEAWAGLDSS